MRLIEYKMKNSINGNGSFVWLMSPHILLNKILSVKSEIKMHPRGSKKREGVHFMERCPIISDFSKMGMF